MTLLLASRSPRRALLLREAGYCFEQADPPFDDPPTPPEVSPKISPEAVARDLAVRKAFSFPACDKVILAADTVCVGANSLLIGTPTTRDEARTMIAHFRNQTHQVVTGIALRTDDNAPMACFADTAAVVFGQVNDDQIEAYLDTEQWQGKAGGYNLFDRQADGWPIHVKGDPTTVVGLPMQKLIPVLANLGIHPA